jgi:hypothetical protein
MSLVAGSSSKPLMPILLISPLLQTVSNGCSDWEIKGTAFVLLLLNSSHFCTPIPTSIKQDHDIPHIEHNIAKTELS